MAAHEASRDKLAIHASDPVAEAGRKIIARQYRRMIQQEAGSRTGADIESVHRMRVAIRRMRSLLRLIPDHYQARTARQLQSGLREIARNLGAVRDLDVLILDLERFAASLPRAEQAPLRSVVQRLDQRRIKRRQRINRLFDSKGYARILRRLKRFANRRGQGARRIDRRAPRELRHVLPVLLHQRLASVRAYDALLPAGDVEDLHDLRVEFKQLRYALEFFQPILGASAAPYLRHVRAMQDLLGRIQDISVFIEAISRLKKLTAEERTALASYCSARLAEQVCLRQDFDEQWRGFNLRATQRQFSDALLVLR